MNLLNTLAEVSMYTLAWVVMSCGFTFVLAAAFFGYPKEIYKEKFDERKDVDL
jgi:hypothetical protein